MFMWASYTSGTYPFLLNLVKNHQNFEFYFMKNNHSVIVYYEHNRRKSIFVSGKTYAILAQHKDLSEKGFVSMEHIPVSSDSAKVFEQQLLDLFPELCKRYGVIAMRMLKNKKKHEYILMTQWKKELYWDRWRDSPMYEYQNAQKLARPSAYFAERPFTNTYIMVEEEDE